MGVSKLMLIRHAEKPVEGGPRGVDLAGRPDKDSLIPLGWQRAGALVRLFAPLGASVPGLAVPDAIFAAGPSARSPSTRSWRTVQPLAAALGLEVNLQHGKREEAALAAAVRATGGAVLVAWAHEFIPAIVAAFGPAEPRKWPDDRFDLVWVLDRAGDGWSFTAVPQRVLPGDG